MRRRHFNVSVSENFNEVLDEQLLSFRERR